jgi:hypothetical protein
MQYVVVDTENGQAWGPFETHDAAVHGAVDVLVMAGETTSQEWEITDDGFWAEQAQQDLGAFNLLVIPVQDPVKRSATLEQVEWMTK